MNRVLKRTLYLFGALLLAWLLLPKPPLLDGIAFSQAVYDRQQHLLRLNLSSDEKYRSYVPLKDISPNVIQATLLQEDQYFYYHLGINPIALGRAVWSTYLSSGRRMGASTITMQVARSRFNIDSRHLSGKLLQLYRALQLERHYSKDQILEAYLNLVSYGSNIEGIGAASLIYFNKPAKSLNLVESLTLSVIPQSPSRRTPDAIDNPAEYAALNQARQQLFQRWVKLHPADATLQTALSLPLTTQSRQHLPYRASHFVNQMITAYPGEPSIQTYLDWQQQTLLERHVRQYVKSKQHLGINNAAAMLVDYRDMTVRALVGSADFDNAEILGQINGTLAKRSPGSTLKPFIYALGMDQGIIHPQSMLKDTPTNFGGYNPENFDREFAGPIKAHDALIKSRNLPAVTIAAQLKQPTLYEFLKKAGIWLPYSENYYGLALTLGGAEVTMQDLIKLYAALANRGQLRPLRWRPSDPLIAGQRILSEEASFMALSILKDNPRPAQYFRSEWTRDNQPVYWKTGTSHGFRDAWSVGIVGPYVLAVWIGNFDGQENPAFIGAEAAAPLMFQIIDALRYQDPQMHEPVHTMPANLAKVSVCAVSGQIPGPYCHHVVPTWFIPGVSPIKICDIHRQVTLHAHSGKQTCQPGAPGTTTAIYEFWPSDLLKLFQQAGIPRRTPPALSSDCTFTATSGLAPQISSPHTAVTYALRLNILGKETIPFTAITDADVRESYWFINDRYLGKVARNQTYYWLAKPGNFNLRVVDDHGRAATRDFNVTIAR